MNRRRISHSAIARLITHAAPVSSAVCRLGVAESGLSETPERRASECDNRAGRERRAMQYLD
jgi:hypothetical protein